jgi:hypothetical protein
VDNGLVSAVRNMTVFDGLALLIALGLVGVGFVIGSTFGSGETGSTTSVELTVTPDGPDRPLAPGTTKAFPVYIKNPNDYGVRVASISEGSSAATASGCPAGTITSAGVEGPAGFIHPGGVRTYEVMVTRSASTDSRCKDQTFTLPLNVTLASAAADRRFSFGSS